MTDFIPSLSEPFVPQLAIRPRRRRLGLLLAVLGSVSVATGAVWQFQRNRVPVVPQTAPVERRDVQVSVTASGSLEALTTVDVGSEVSGKIVELLVNENDPVRRGQTLAKIAPQDLKLAVDQALAELRLSRASVAETNATFTEASLALKRAQKLREPGLVGEQALESARANQQRALASISANKAKVQLAEAALALAESRLNKATITSPIDGVVLTRLVEPGQTLTAGFQTPQLFKLAEDLTKLRLKVSIAEADIARVRVGQVASFTVDAYPERSFESRVVSLANEAETKQGVVTFRASLEVDNSALLLRPGMSSVVRIVTVEHPQALAVPNAALRYRGPDEHSAIDSGVKRHLWVLEGEAPHRIEVQVGEKDGDFTELLKPALPVGTRLFIAAESEG